MNENLHNQPFPKEEIIDLKKYFYLILKNWYWFIVCLIITLSLAFLINRYTMPVYEASSTIIMWNEMSSFEQMFGDIFINKRRKRLESTVENEIVKLRSFDINYRTIMDLDFDITYVGVGRSGLKEVYLYNKSPFIVVSDSLDINAKGKKIHFTIIDSTRFKIELNEGIRFEKVLSIGEKFSDYGLNFSIYPRNTKRFTPNKGYNKYYFVINDPKVLTEKFRTSLIMEPIGTNVSVIKLISRGGNIDKHVNYLNKLAETFISAGLEEKNLQSENAIIFLDNLINDLIDTLKISGNELQKFRISNDIININQEGNALFIQIQQLQQEKAELLVNSKFFEYIAEYINSINDFNQVITPSIIGINGPVLNTMVNKLNELYSTRNVLKVTAKKFNPYLNPIDSQIESARLVLREHIFNQLKISDIALTDIDQRLRFAEQEIRKLPAKEQEFLNMSRSYEINNQFYTYLLQKRAEAGISNASNVPNNKILDRARRENTKMIRPRKSVTYLGSLFIGIILPIIFIFLRDFFNTKVGNRKYIEQNTSVPILGSIMHNKTGSDLIIADKPKSSLAESFRVLRTNLNYMIPGGNQNIITISSMMKGEGKTFCAINLASIYAFANRKTLLVGMDLRKPSIHKIFSIDNQQGLSTYLIGNNSISEIIQESNFSNLYITPSGPVPPNPAELIDSQRMIEFLTTVKSQFEYIIIDTPPIALVTDALLISDLTDLYITIIRQGFSNKGVINILNNIYENNIKHLSILINDVKSSGYYGYYYGYDYGYYFGSRYGYGQEYYSEES